MSAGDGVESDLESDLEEELSLEEQLLYSSRHGDISRVQSLLQARIGNPEKLNVSCRGQAKSNYGWTPLHLATYFGHPRVAELLLQHGADANAANDNGDTALHKAAFIGHQELVVILLQYGAEVSILNGEGCLPRDVAKTPHEHALLKAAEAQDTRSRELKLLAAARQGDAETVNYMLLESRPPSINCVDAQGNSCLHCAAYRGHEKVAVVLLQNGIDVSIRNMGGQRAQDLARDRRMKQLLSVTPLQQQQKTASRKEGLILRKSRFLGWKPLWIVLQRGVLTYHTSRAEAGAAVTAASVGSAGLGRRDCKYLDGARVVPAIGEQDLMVLHFSDGTAHRLRIPPQQDLPVLAIRQEWITSIKEHIAYSAYYLWGHEENSGVAQAVSVGSSSQGRPLGSMTAALNEAKNQLGLLETQLGECGALVQALERSSQLGSTLHQSAHLRFQHASDTGQRVLSALSHALTLVTQADESGGARLKAERERCRVLEEALAVLAQEHHDLEQSFAEQVSETKSVPKKPRPSRFYEHSDEEFHDAFEADSDSDTIVSGRGLSPLGTPSPPGTPNTPSPPLLHDKSLVADAVLSPASSSCSTIMTCDGHVYRNARDDIEPSMLHVSRTSLPVAMFSRNDFSVWSVLKNCIGKELSKITMPVVFNEPLSFLQRMLEYLEYARLLRLASEQEDPIKRMHYVAGFAVSALASNRERLGKPFNPLLGETYELQRPEFRALAEQVSHHPPVSAFHADSPHFIFHGSVYPKLRFWGKSVEIQPKGQVTVELPRWGEAYTWNNVNCCVHNIIVGRLWMEQYGTMEVVCHSRGSPGTPGLRAQLVFKPAGWASKDLHRVEGYILDHNKRKINFLYGKWTEFIKCCDMRSYEEWCREHRRDEGGGSSSGGGQGSDSPAHTPRRVLAKLNSLKVGAFKSVSLQESDEPPIPEPADGEIPKSDSTYSIDIPDSVTIWEAVPRPDNSAEFYQFTSFAMSLNELEEAHGDRGQRLCPTDSRLRPDVRCLERGDVDGAAKEKTRLEDKQRVARKQAKKHPLNSAPRWFSQGTNPYTKQEDWLYNGGYWDRNYQHLKDVNIF